MVLRQLRYRGTVWLICLLAQFRLVTETIFIGLYGLDFYLALLPKFFNIKYTDMLTATQKIEKFTPENLRTMRKAIDDALAKVAADYGLQSLRIGNISYSPDGYNFSTKLTADLQPSANDPVVIKAQTDASNMLGYQENIVGLTFTNGQKTYKVTNINLRKRSFPIEAICLEDQKAVAFSGKRNINFKEKAVAYDISSNIFRF